MGFNSTLIGFPVLVLMISSILGGAGGWTGSGSVNLGGAAGGAGTNFTAQGCTQASQVFFPPNEFFCSQIFGLGGSGNTIALASISLFYPTTIDGCATPCNAVFQIKTPAGAQPDVQASCTGPTVASNGGLTFTCVTTSNYSLTTQNSSNVILSFGGVQLSGGFFIAFIGIAIVAITLIGIQVLGSGIGTESIHIIFIGGTLFGIWLIFSSAEGFLTGASSSFFTQLNGAFSGFGTDLYALLTLMFLMGVISGVSRGGGAS